MVDNCLDTDMDNGWTYVTYVHDHLIIFVLDDLCQDACKINMYKNANCNRFIDNIKD